MASSTELIALINTFSLTERLRIVEEVLRGMREEKSSLSESAPEKYRTTPRILELAGIMTEEEADELTKAVVECREL